MEQKNNTLEQAYVDFISTASHELRTPLTSIRGFAETLISSYDRLDKEQRLRFLHIIKDQSNRLISLVENMLSAAKLNTDKELIVYKTAFVLPLAEEAVQIVKNQYKTHKYIVQCSKNLPPVLIDTDRFIQIMINLIDNASKYSDENTNVTITAGQNCSDNTVFVSVKDEGAGIKPDDMQKIFNKFSRIDSPLTRKVQGSGLGLYITKTLVEKMNGKIEVKSPADEHGRGSVFTVSFKAAALDDAAKKKLMTEQGAE